MFRQSDSIEQIQNYNFIKIEHNTGPEVEGLGHELNGHRPYDIGPMSRKRPKPRKKYVTVMDTDTKLFENLGAENRVWTRICSQRVTGVHRTLWKQSTKRCSMPHFRLKCPVISSDKFAEFPIINWRASYFLLRDHCIMKCMRTSFLNSITEIKWPSTHRGQIKVTRSVHFSRNKRMILKSIYVKAINYRHVLENGQFEMEKQRISSLSLIMKVLFETSNRTCSKFNSWDTDSKFPWQVLSELLGASLRGLPGARLKFILLHNVDNVWISAFGPDLSSLRVWEITQMSISLWSAKIKIAKILYSQHFSK